MMVPVGIFMLLNQNPDTFKGWGIPMATDIAFSLAVLKLLGDKVPLSLKVFLTAFAIVDDLGAVLVIALFYSGNIKLGLLLTALILLAVLYVLSYKGYYSKFVMVVFGVIIWTLFLKADIHPTLAGVLLAFSVPIGQKIKTPEFVENLETITANIKMASVLKKPILSAEQINEIDNLEEWSNKYQSPLQRLEHNLHNWVAYFIIPIFALANAGITINSNIQLDMALAINIAIGLIVGKSIGISSIIFISKKLKFIDIPLDISPRQIIGVSFLGGIGFTMSIFIASLAFIDNLIYLDSAKIGILIGSLLSAICGYIILNTKSARQES
jgi:NhaA family Na+:H+ antiporter